MCVCVTLCVSKKNVRTDKHTHTHTLTTLSICSSPCNSVFLLLLLPLAIRPNMCVQALQRHIHSRQLSLSLSLFPQFHVPTLASPAQIISPFSFPAHSERHSDSDQRHTLSQPAAQRDTLSAPYNVSLRPGAHFLAPFPSLSGGSHFQPSFSFSFSFSFSTGRPDQSVSQSVCVCVREGRSCYILENTHCTLNSRLGNSCLVRQ